MAAASVLSRQANANLLSSPGGLPSASSSSSPPSVSLAANIPTDDDSSADVPLVYWPLFYLTSPPERPIELPNKMVRLSNNLVGVLNFVTFLLSIPILAGGIWLSNRGSTDCEKFLQGPVIALGVFLMVVSLAGLVGACCRNSLLLWIYLAVMFILILLLFCFTVFAFLVTNKGAGQVVSERGYKEYRLGDYSNWLQKRVENSKNWAKIRSCLVDSKICQSLQEGNQTFDQFIRDNLSPLQSGCCKPPTECGFVYQNATVWNVPPGFTTSSNTDCTTWQNDQSVLCYDCQSCKAGVLANIKNDWKKVATLNIIFLVFLIIVYSVGCCAFRNNMRDNAHGWKGYQ